MSARFYYRNQDGDITEITDRIRQDGGIELTTNAEEGSVGTGRVVIDDPDGDFVIGGHRLFFMEENEASPTRVFTGYTAERTYERMDPRVDVSRRITVTIVDQNSVLFRRVLRTSSANRPDETDVARVQWVEATGVGSLIDDTTYLSTANPVGMDDADYRGQYLNDVMDDAAHQSGKNYFVLDVDNGGGPEFSLWYGSDSSTDFSSACRISNVLDDVDESITFPPSLDASMERSPSRVYSGVYGNYNGGHVYEDRDATEDEFALGGRDTIASWPNVKRASRASARAIRMLEDISTEEDTITCFVIVPLAKVNEFRAGMRIEALFTHFPDYNDYTWMRILSRTVSFFNADHYKVDLTLSATPPAPPAPSCATVLSGFEFWDSGAQEFVDDGPPIAFAPTLSSGMVIGLFACVNNGEPVARKLGDATTEAVSGFTQWGNSRGTTINDYSSLAMAGYASGGGTMSVTFSHASGTGAASWRAIACAFDTAATSPVQTATQYGTGFNAVLGSPPTSGNILVLAKFAETNGFAPPDPPTGWTRIGSVETFEHEVGYQSIELCARCVVDGEDATIYVGNATHSHWAFVSEWEIT